MDDLHRQAHEAKRRTEAVKWLRLLCPEFDLPVDSSEDEVRAALEDGVVLCGVLSRVDADFSAMLRDGEDGRSYGNVHSEKLRWFVSAVEGMGLISFNAEDLEEGTISAVVECLLCLKDHFGFDVQGDGHHANGFCVNGNLDGRKWFTEVEQLNISSGDCFPNGNNPLLSRFEKKNMDAGTEFQGQICSYEPSEPTALLCHAGEKFQEVLQLREGCFSDIPASRITEMINSYDLTNASIPTLLSIAYGIVDKSIEKMSGEVPDRVICLLKMILQEIEQHSSHQAERIEEINCLAKVREEKYKLRMRVLETLATGTSEEIKLTKGQLHLLESEKLEMEDMLGKEHQGTVRLMKEKETCENRIEELNEELEVTIRSHEEKFHKLQTKHSESTSKFEERIKELQSCLIDSQSRNKELESILEFKAHGWNKKEFICQNFVTLQSHSVQDLRAVSNSIKRDMLNIHKIWDEEFTMLGIKLKGLTDAAENYHTVLAENRRLYNEVQELRGNIRVYCRIRPFLHGQNGKMTCIDYIGENGEILVVNPTKQGKDGQRMFKFNKIFGPTASQEQVFVDIQPLIRSVLDGYNVCIFAYGQTGSGKTYTMSGPSGNSKEEWGVNYRALNDLFYISRTRRSAFMYEVGVQMVEIYNEQVRDLLSNDSTQKKLGIWNSSQPNGLAVPDASLHPVNSTSDVLELMQIGQMNRAVGATALNERSSRSHSVVTVHVRGTDLESGTSLRGCLHLVDLAGSERVDRSEATGDRLKEAQHINKSLSALGDVISALSQKNIHVPYRNSKLTQVLQSSLGGQAKTLMFVQINPDTESYSETISTLKFAERVSGVELGAAKSNKEGKDITNLLEQVASLKDAIARKDEETERLRQMKEMKPRYANIGSRKLTSNSQRPSLTSNAQRRQKILGGKPIGFLLDKAASDPEICSDYSDRHSEVGSLQSIDDFKHQRDTCFHSRVVEGDSADIDPLGLDSGDLDERLSDISDSVLSMGTETDGSICSIVEYTLFPEVRKPVDDGKPTETDKPASNNRPSDESEPPDNGKPTAESEPPDNGKPTGYSKPTNNRKEKLVGVPPRLPPSPLQKGRSSGLAQSRLKETLRSSSLQRRDSTSKLAPPPPSVKSLRKRP